METAINQIAPQLPVDFQAEFTILKAVEEKKDVQDAEKQGTWIVEGFASTGDLDAQEHRITAEAQQEGAASLEEYNTLLYNHDPDKPIGKILKAEAREDRLFIKTFISHSEPIIWQKVQDGTLSKFSIKGQILDSGTETDEETQKEITVIKSMKLFEVSLVSVPANVKAKSLAWYIEKALADAKVSKEISDPTHDNINTCMASRSATLIESGMSVEAALAQAKIDCETTHKANEVEEKRLKRLKVKKDDKDAEKAGHRDGDAGGSMADCVARKTSKFMEQGMDAAAARTKATRECAAKSLAEKAGHTDGKENKGGSFADCVAEHAKKFRAEGMDSFTARRKALQACADKKAALETDEETVDRLCAEYPWLVDVIDKVEAKLKEEGGVQEDMNITKNASEGLQSAITTLEGINDELEGEDKEQVAAVVRSLNALLTGTGDEGAAGASDAGDAGEADAEAAKDVSTKGDAAEVKTTVAEDLAQLMKVFEEKMDENLKLMREALAKVESSTKETKEASAVAVEAKADIEKKATEVKEVAEKLPIRKAAGPEAEDTKNDRTGKQLEKGLKDRVIEKVGEKEYANAKPGQQLQWLIEERALIAGGN